MRCEEKEEKINCADRKEISNVFPRLWVGRRERLTVTQTRNTDAFLKRQSLEVGYVALSEELGRIPSNDSPRQHWLSMRASLWDFARVHCQVQGNTNGNVIFKIVQQKFAIAINGEVDMGPFHMFHTFETIRSSHVP